MAQESEIIHYLSRMSECNPMRMVKQVNVSTAGLGFIVGYLHQHREETILAGDLAKASGVSTARIAAALKKLEQQELIVRTPYEKDSRKVVVSLTEAGTRQAEDMQTKLHALIGTIIDTVGKEDLDEYLRISAKISQAVLRNCEG